MNEVIMQVIVSRIVPEQATRLQSMNCLVAITHYIDGIWIGLVSSFH
jgi:hypothetical protein